VHAGQLALLEAGQYGCTAAKAVRARERERVQDLGVGDPNELARISVGDRFAQEREIAGLGRMRGELVDDQAANQEVALGPLGRLAGVESEAAPYAAAKGVEIDHAQTRERARLHPLVIAAIHRYRLQCSAQIGDHVMR
jgi:hypothetical protein